ncbi:MAG: hypothetical protein WCT77_10815 [Bacteroidota bacterium]
MSENKSMLKMRPNLMTMLSEAQTWVHEHKKEGVICPCCKAKIKVYKRKLNSTMMLFLIALNKLDRRKPNDIYFHVKEILQVAGAGRSVGLDYCILKHYRFIEAMGKDEEDTTKKTSGYWKITERAKQFLSGKIKVPSHVFTFMENKFSGFSDELIGPLDAIDNHFDFEELMNQ